MAPSEPSPSLLTPISTLLSLSPPLLQSMSAEPGGAEGPTTPAVPPEGLGGVCGWEGMSPEEERRAWLEHALSSLEVEVEQRGELLADLGAIMWWWCGGGEGGEWWWSGGWGGW
jgi:hypothetical protein